LIHRKIKPVSLTPCLAWVNNWNW